MGIYWGVDYLELVEYHGNAPHNLMVNPWVFQKLIDVWRALDANQGEYFVWVFPLLGWIELCNNT